MRRPTVIRSAFTLGLAAMCAASARADEVRLKDGTVLIGKTRVRDDVVQVTTRDGTRRVPLADAFSAIRGLDASAHIVLEFCAKQKVLDENFLTILVAYPGFRVKQKRMYFVDLRNCKR